MKKFACIILIIIGVSCQRYKDSPTLVSPAYVRVFNDVAIQQDPFHVGRALPFFTFLFDPHTDANGIADGAAIVGDYLNTRQLLSLSYPLNAGNSGKSATNALFNNYDYPGNQHVLTAPPINGLDLSAWAQMPSGKHHILFVERPFSDTPFSHLPSVIRSQKVIDTTINLEPGEVYTIHAVARNVDSGKYRAYVRKENFIHQSFSPDSIYVRFLNLSGERPFSAKFNSGYSDYLQDSLNIYYSYSAFNDDYRTPFILPFFDNVYYSTLYGSFKSDAPYLKVPLLGRSYFFDKNGNLRQYYQFKGDKFSSLPSTLPTLSFYIYNKTQTESGLPYIARLNCQGDPTTVNQLPAQTVSVSRNEFGFYLLPDLNIVANINGSINVYGSINTIEIVGDRFYIMQVQHFFN